MNRDEVMAAYDAVVHARGESTVQAWSDAYRQVEAVRSVLSTEALAGRALLAKPQSDEDAMTLAVGLEKRSRLLAKFDGLAVEVWDAYSAGCEELLEMSSWMQ